MFHRSSIEGNPVVARPIPDALDRILERLPVSLLKAAITHQEIPAPAGRPVCGATGVRWAYSLAEIWSGGSAAIDEEIEEELCEKRDVGLRLGRIDEDGRGLSLCR